MKALSFAICIAATLLSFNPAHAATEEEGHNQIETLLGDADGFDDVLNTVTDAIRFDDPDSLATATDFPLSNSGEDVQDSEGLADRWSELFNDKVKTALDSGRYDEMIVNSEGVGIGNGAIWINRFCDNDSCSKAHWALARVNY